MTELSIDELTKFGIVEADEGVHPFSPDHWWWNESWFLDWFDASGQRAGHLRFGLHPNQERAFIWVFLYEDGEWLACEEARVPLGDVDQDALAIDSYGLSVRWDRSDPLRGGRLVANGHGRIVMGPRAGLVLPFSIDLAYRAAGAAHSGGPRNVEGHRAEGYATNRFEQPVTLEGAFGVGEGTPFVGRGERDHSWGPRDWNIEWTFLVLGGEEFRLQCALVDLPGLDRIVVGYLNRDESVEINAADDALVFGDADLVNPVSGRIALHAIDGTSLAGALETVSGVEIDITHCFDPPRATVYRRSLVRFTPDTGTPVLGWLERNHFHRI
jgi:hypothetical protein